jgi:hypothetical protein
MVVENETTEALIATIAQCHERAAALGTAARDWQYRAICREQGEAQIELARCFGWRYGWRLTQRHFALSVLAKDGTGSGRMSLDRGFGGMHHDFFDHGYYYRVDSPPCCNRCACLRLGAGKAGGGRGLGRATRARGIGARIPELVVSGPDHIAAVAVPQKFRRSDECLSRPTPRTSICARDRGAGCERAAAGGAQAGPEVFAWQSVGAAAPIDAEARSPIKPPSFRTRSGDKGARDGHPRTVKGDVSKP